MAKNRLNGKVGLIVLKAIHSTGPVVEVVTQQVLEDKEAIADFTSSNTVDLGAAKNELKEMKDTLFGLFRGERIR